MEATLRLRPLAAFSACLLPLAAGAAEPLDKEAFETPVLLLSAEDECDSDGAADNGRTGLLGRSRQGGAARGYGGTATGYRASHGRDGHGNWFDSEHDTGPVGSSQKCRHGKLYPPYPRPAENGEWSTQFHATMYWPWPYNCWDRSYVKQIQAIQTANGWAQATTLYAYHFETDTNCLNHSGQIHLRWILEQCPQQYRTVYVQSAGSAVVSDARLAAVRSAAADIAGTPGTAVVVRPVMLAGRPANEVDSIRRQEVSTMPQPRIEIQDVGTGSGSGQTNN